MKERKENGRRGWAGFLLPVLAAAALCLLPWAGATAYAAERPVKITSCTIEGDTVVCRVSASSLPASDNGTYYLYADEVYQDGAAGEMIATQPRGAGAVFRVPLRLNEQGDNLSRKFLVCVRQNGTMVQVSDEHYITNPEAAATYAAPRMQVGIKGLLPDGDVRSGDLQELGIQQVVNNLNLSELCGETSNPLFPTIVYNHDGQEWHFNGYTVNAYNELVRYFNSLGIQVTLAILNDASPHTQDLIHPMSKDGHSCPGYAFNTAEAGGVAHLKAIASFLGWYFSGQEGHGQVDNWVVGNEVNARTEWYYLQSDDLDLNVNCYAKAFRIFYNGIKSENASAWVYNSIDQEWARKSNPGCFLSREFLDTFNYYIRREGNIDWGLSFHPYNSPLYDPYAWMGLTRWVRGDLTSPYITMQNFSVLTDYISTPEYLNPAGQVRSVSIAEIGFTSSFGEDAQSASIVYGYLMARKNPHVDSFMLFRLNDHPHEMESNIAQGLKRTNGTYKPSYDFYKYMGTAQEAEYVQKASNIIGMDMQELVNSGRILTRESENY